VAQVVTEPSDEPEVNPWLFHGSVWAAIIVVLIVGCGILAENRLWALAFAVAVTPPILITLVVSAVSRARGGPISPLAKTLIGLGVFALTVPLALVALVLAVVIGLFQICTSGSSPLFDALGS
jgi:hypothetical protein